MVQYPFMTKPWCYIIVGDRNRVKIDKEDLAKVKCRSWRVTLSTTGRRRVVTSIRNENKVRSVTLGAFLMKPSKGKQVYPRRFNDELDYRKDNLLVCTLRERQQLLPKKRSQTTSQFRGVSLVRSSGKWRAGIEVNGHSINLGAFKSEEEAARAYNRAAKKYFGKMAYQNQIRKRKNRRR